MNRTTLANKVKKASTPEDIDLIIAELVRLKEVMQPQQSLQQAQSKGYNLLAEGSKSKKQLEELGVDVAAMLEELKGKVIVIHDRKETRYMLK